MATNPIVRKIRKIGAQRHEPASHIKAALETGRVESNFTNPSGGDADSAGWRQERRSLYKDPTNVNASINRFYNETDQLDHGQKSYQLAADVQRPAARYRGRYKDVSKEAQSLLKGGGSKGSTGRPATTLAATSADGSQDPAAARRAALQNYLLTENTDSSALLNLAANLKTAKSSSAPAPTHAPDVKTALKERRASGVSPHAKPGDPVVSGKQSEGGQHETEGLPGYPAHDYFAPAGSHAVAPVGGKVIKLSGHDPADGPTEGPHGPLGWSVYIKGSDGKTYFLTHMGSRDVKVGQAVKQGQVIGTVADYDKYGTPSHIHMGVNG